jgi:DNA end-binding protein Ku
MRAIWKGAVSFGLVSIAVKLYSATEEKSIRFHQVHRTDGGRIRYQRVCSVCGKEVSYDDIAKGYDIGGGEIVVLTDEDFEGLPLSTSRAIDVLEFVPAGQIDPILFNKAYYLEPEGTATKPYVLLRDALADSQRVAVVKVALRQREQLATLRVHEGVLVLNTMLWPDEVRAPEFGFLDEEVVTREPELAMAASLIDSMTGDFDADNYADNYREALQEVIDAKVEGREVETPAEPERAPAAVDLMAALRASVERAQAARQGGMADQAGGKADQAGEKAGQAGGKAGQAGGKAGRAGGKDAKKDRKPVEPTPISSARSRRGKPADGDGQREPKSGKRTPKSRKSA